MVMMSSIQHSYVINGINDTVTTDGQNDGPRPMLETLLSVSYGLHLTSFKRLGGYDDINYHVTAVKEGRAHEARAENLSANSYVLRIFSAKNSSEPQRIKATNAVMDHVTHRGIVTPHQVMDGIGQSLSLWKFVNQDKEELRVVCLRTYLAGQTIRDLTNKMSWSAHMFFKLGIFVAKLTSALEDFHHEFFDSFNFSWSVDNIHNLKEMTHFVKSRNTKGAVEGILDQLSAQLSEIQTADDKKGIVHGDISLTNIILENSEDFFGDFERWGIIDFNDVHKTHPLCELANAACSLWEVPMTEKLQPLDAIGHLVTGYQSILPLNLREMRLLVALMKARLCMMVVYGCHACYLDPDNVDYIGISLQPACHMLEDLHGTATEDVVERLMDTKN